MRIQALLTALLITTTSPAFAQLDWVFASTDGDGNAQHTSSLPITTNPQKYQTIWETQIFPSENDHVLMRYNLLIADNKIITHNAYIYYYNGDFLTDMNALDTETGKTLWSTQINSYQENPITYNHGQIITLLNNGANNQSTLAAYDIKSGQNIYSVMVDNDIAHLTSFGDFLYFSKSNHAVGSINAKDGSINWVKSLDAGIYFSSSLSVNGNYILTREYNNVRVYDISTGAQIKKIWVQDAFGGNFTPAPIVDGDSAYGVFGNQDYITDGSLYAFDLNTKQIKWSVPNQYNEYGQQFQRSMLLTNNIIVSQSYTSRSSGPDRLNFIDAKSGRMIGAWLIPGEEQLNSSYEMVATLDTVFIACAKHVYAISLATRQVVWTSDKIADHLYLGSGKLFMQWKNDKKESLLTAVALN